jgi:hypothetical protein
MLMDYNHNVEVNMLKNGSCQKTGAFFLFGLIVILMCRTVLAQKADRTQSKRFFP